MLKAREFTICNGINTSHGNMELPYETQTYVILYNPEVYDDTGIEEKMRHLFLSKNLTAFDNAALTESNNIAVILPKDIWKTLSGLIKDNYILTEKQ